MQRFAMGFILILTLATTGFSQVAPFSSARSDFRNLTNQQSVASGGLHGTLTLTPTASTTSLGHGYAIAVPQFWVTHDGAANELAMHGEIPTWIKILTPTGTHPIDAGTTAVADFSALIGPSFNVLSSTASTESHIGSEMMEAMLGGDNQVTVNDMLAASQPMVAGTTLLDWQVLRVPGWNHGTPASNFWGNSFHYGQSGRQEVSALRLMENAIMMEAPSAFEGKDFITSPAFSRLWDTDELGISIQYICVRNDEPDMLHAGDVAILLSDPMWITPTSTGTGGNPFGSILGNFGLQFFLASNSCLVSTSVLNTSDALEVLDTDFNLLMTIPLVPSAWPFVYMQTHDPLPLPFGQLKFRLYEVPLIPQGGPDDSPATPISGPGSSGGGTTTP